MKSLLEGPLSTNENSAVEEVAPGVVGTTNGEAAAVVVEEKRMNHYCPCLLSPGEVGFGVGYYVERSAYCKQVLSLFLLDSMVGTRCGIRI